MKGDYDASPCSPDFAECANAYHPARQQPASLICADDDYRFYRAWLQEYAVKTGCEVHAYVLMTNHVHLLVSAGTSDSVGALMKALGQRYAQYANRCYRRTGSLWEGRFRSCLTPAESYLLGRQRYIELNPVRARMVERPADYQWSSYRANGLGKIVR